MKRPKLTKEEALQMIKDRGVIFTEPVKILAVRGYYKDTMGERGVNDQGIYDDAIFLIAPNYFQAFNANTDPSKRTPGVAKLMAGLHYFVKGKHGISRPGGGYPAFRPATSDESLPVTREGKEGVFKGIAINLHSGGEIYTNSAGCQTIYKGQWFEFQTTAYKLMDKEGQRVLPYLLIEN
jgi:lysozyme